MRRAVLAMLFGLSCFSFRPAHAAELKQETVEAFGRYVQAAEARMDEDLRGNRFLWIDRFAASHRENHYAQLRHGKVLVERVELPELEKIKISHGLVHHWVAMCFIPGGTVSQTVALLQDYDHHQDIYKPDVVRSKLLSANGNDFKVYLRLYRKAIVTAIFNAEFDVRYVPLDPSRWYSQSYSTRIAEVENAGKPDEREKPVGRDRGFLWRLNSYWRFEEKDGGVYVQLESIALSRSVPALIAWFVNPLLRSVPRDYLSRLLTATRDALEKKSASPRAGGDKARNTLKQEIDMPGVARDQESSQGLGTGWLEYASGSPGRRSSIEMCACT